MKNEWKNRYLDEMLKDTFRLLEDAEKGEVDLLVQESEGDDVLGPEDHAHLMKSLEKPITRLKTREGIRSYFSSVYAEGKKKYITFQKMLVQLREKCDLSIDEFSKLADIKPAHYKKFENECFPLSRISNFNLFVHILNFLNITLYKLAEIKSIEEKSFDFKRNLDFGTAGAELMLGSMINPDGFKERHGFISQPIRPSSPDFFNEVQAEMEKKGFDHLLP